MKGLYTSNTRVSEPIAKGTLSGYGLGCLGGFVDKGKATFFPLIGGNIMFNPESLEGQITMIRQPTLDTGSIDFGMWHNALAKLRSEMRSIIANKLITIADTTKRKKATITNTLTILNQFKFKAFIQTMNISQIVREIYNSKWLKGMVAFDEEFLCFSFTEKGTKIPAQGTLHEGLDYYIARVPNSQAQITRVRVNKGAWLAWIVHIGYDHRIAALEWLRLYHVYGSAGDHTIDVESMLDAIFDEISKRPTLSSIPDLSAYIADTLIQIGLFNLTVNAINAEEWLCTSNYAMIMENVSDKQISAQLKILTEEWIRPQVLVPGSDLGPKVDMAVLPFWDGKFINAKMPHPAVSISEIQFSDSDFREGKEGQATSPGAEEKTTRLKLAQIVTINACADGGENPNHIVFNRIIGPLSSLSDDGRISQICLDAVYPWILGLQQPDDSNVQLERRHWPLVYLHSVFDEPPVSAPSLNEAMLIGLKSFIGPKFYLCDLSLFTKNTALDIIMGTKANPERKTITGNLYDDKITIK
jgi:hypothetical protein